MENNMLEEVNGELCIKDASEDYMLIGYVGKKAVRSGEVFCQYIPQSMSDEEYAKKYLANKKYAFVRYEYPDDKYANQKGEVLDERTNENGSKSYLLKINVRQKGKGRHIHYVALMPIYEEVWFSESDIAKFLEYDENGKEIRK